MIKDEITEVIVAEDIEEQINPLHGGEVKEDEETVAGAAGCAVRTSMLPLSTPVCPQVYPRSRWHRRRSWRRVLP